MSRKPNNCADCGTPISHYATYCMAHRFTGSRNPIYGTKRPDHVKDAISQAQRGVPESRRGSAHQSWKGEAVSASSGRRRANEMHAKPECCEMCGESKRLDWHHIDENTSNNERANLAALCRRCHQKVDGRHDYLRTEMHRLGRIAQGRSA